MQKYLLNSDFVDFYDHWFDNEGELFHRHSESGMNRIEMFQFLRECGLQIPKFGLVKDMINVLPINSNLVIHTDISNKSHRGENKLLDSMRFAVQTHPDCFSSEFIGDFIGISWRYLSIGSKHFWLRYESDDWRSNVNNKRIEIENRIPFLLNLDYPLYAIDFVKKIEYGQEIFLAIDFNIAPQIKGTGIENILKPKEVAKEIKTYLEGLN